MNKPKNIYLIATYYAKPRNPRQTFNVGYMKDDQNIAWDEQVIVTVGLRDRDLSTAKIVLDIIERKVVKNSFNNDKTFEELFSYFYTSSPKEISSALQKVGIMVEEKEDSKESTINTLDEPIQHQSETNVSGETQEGSRPESSASANSAVSGESNQKRRRKRNVDPTDSTAATGTDQIVETELTADAIPIRHTNELP